MKRKVWNITVKDNPNRVVMGENDEFYTTDTEAYLVFKLDDKNFNPATAVLTLENRTDGSLKNETVDVVDGLIEWEMPQRYIEHFGNWQGQLVYEDTKDGQPELYTSAPFSFVVNAHIGDKKKPSLVEIENWEKFIREGTELIETWEDMEDLRQANEAQRQANYQELLDTGVLQTNINTKLEALEEEYAPKLTEVTAQLAQTGKQITRNAERNTGLATYKNSNALVSFVDDDAHTKVMSILLPLSQKHDIPFTLAVVSDFAKTNQGLGFEELKELQDLHGFEIGSHGKTHTPLNDNLSEKEQHEELYESWRALRAEGLDVTSIIYPYGQSTPYGRGVALDYYNVGVSTNSHLNVMPLRQQFLGRIKFPQTGWTLNDYTAQVDEAINNNAWLIWMVHVGMNTESDNQMLDDLMAYVKNSNIETATVSDAIRRLGNLIDFNDREFYFSKNGKNNITNYLVPPADTQTGESKVTLAMTPSDFEPYKSYRASVPALGTPSNRRGMLTVHKALNSANTYREFVDIQGFQFFAYGRSETEWEPWGSQLQIARPKESYTMNETVQAGKTINVHVSLADYNLNRLVLATPTTNLPNGIIHSVAWHSTAGRMQIRLHNTTTVDVTITEIVWDFVVLQTN